MYTCEVSYTVLGISKNIKNTLCTKNKFNEQMTNILLDIPVKEQQSELNRIILMFVKNLYSL